MFQALRQRRGVRCFANGMAMSTRTGFVLLTAGCAHSHRDARDAVPNVSTAIHEASDAGRVPEPSVVDQGRRRESDLECVMRDSPPLDAAATEGRGQGATASSPRASSDWLIDWQSCQRSWEATHRARLPASRTVFVAYVDAQGRVFRVTVPCNDAPLDFVACVREQISRHSAPPSVWPPVGSTVRAPLILQMP
jgi:hypothetical protein